MSGSHHDGQSGSWHLVGEAGTRQQLSSFDGFDADDELKVVIGLLYLTSWSVATAFADENENHVVDNREADAAEPEEELNPKSGLGSLSRYAWMSKYGEK